MTPRCDGPVGVVAEALAVRCRPRRLANERAVFYSMAGGVLAPGWVLVHGRRRRAAAKARGEEWGWPRDGGEAAIMVVVVV